jgi:hypothetical protein
LRTRVQCVAREEECAANHTTRAHNRDKDAQKLLTRWKFGTIYIYSTPSIPTTETTHGFCEEKFDEEAVDEATQQASQSREETREAQREKASRKASH